MDLRDSIQLVRANKEKLFFWLFFIVLVSSSFFILPYEDSYYYWDWSRHLALSYFDGSPLIAYSMHLFTWIFGNTIYAINLLGVVSIYLTLFFIYKTTALAFNKQAALNACLLWLLSPLVINYLFIWVTYDNPLNLFWAATIYFFVRYIKYKKTTDIYLLGGSVGLLLLSKYTGIVLLIALLLFIIVVPRYRVLFKNKHFYGAIFVAVLITSPVLVWNYQHHWASFYYQLTAHTASTWSWENVTSYLGIAIGNYNVLLFLPIYALFRSYKASKQNDVVVLLNFISLTFLLFFLYQACDHGISKHWLVPFCISSAILCGHYFVSYKLRKLFLLTILVYFLISMHYIIYNSLWQKYSDGNVGVYSLIENAAKQYWRQDEVVMTSNWELASKLAFWLPSKPFVYTLPCGAENQYAYWSKPTLQRIKEKSIKEVFYLNLADNSSCVKKYFAECHALPILSYSYDGVRLQEKNKNRHLQLYAYRCVT